MKRIITAKGEKINAVIRPAIPQDYEYQVLDYDSINNIFTLKVITTNKRPTIADITGINGEISELPSSSKDISPIIRKDKFNNIISSD